MAADIIRLQLMDTFTIYINERKADHMSNKSKKGMALVQYLISHRGEQVPNYKILSALWSEEKSSNPENALKTLVSRMRVILNGVSSGLGNCIVADRGAYHWKLLPGMTIDYYEIEDIFQKLDSPAIDDDDRMGLYERLMSLYKGDFLQDGDHNEWALPVATGLHTRYISSVYAYVDMLKRTENYTEIGNVCRTALDVDNFDDRLHMELMTALIHTNRVNEALVQYKHVTNLYYRYLGIQPSEDMQEFYKQIVRANRTIELNMEEISAELIEVSTTRGAFVCEYSVFKELYNLQMRNLERVGSTMFLAVIMVNDANGQAFEPVQQDTIMTKLMDILRNNLRKGDTITRFSPTICALLLPTVNYTTGNMVMERIKHIFYKQHSNSTIQFNYRIAPLNSPKAQRPLPEQPAAQQPVQQLTEGQ